MARFRLMGWLPSRPGTRAAIYLATILVLGTTALFVQQPGFTDSFYYYHVGANLFHGRGFVEDFVWNYLDLPLNVTHPSNAYWGPLASLLLVPSFWLFGTSFRAAQVPMVLVASLLPVLTYLTAFHLLGCRRLALAAATLTIFSGVYLVYWTVPEGYVPFAVAGAAALYATARAREAFDNTNARRAVGAGAVVKVRRGRSSLWWSTLSGAAIGLAQLARGDGALLLVVIVGTWAYVLWRRSGETSFLATARNPAAVLAAYTLIISPWLYRNALAFGSPFFNPALKTLFLRQYNDVFTYGGQLDLAYFLSWGVQAIAASKLSAAAGNLHVLAEALSYYLVPLALAGLWAFRRERRALPYLAYLVALYLAMTFAFTFPGRLGSLLHSAAALLPFLMTAVVLGLDLGIALLVKHRPHLTLPATRRILTLTLVLAQVALTLGLGSATLATWGTRYSYNLYPGAAAWLKPYLAPGEPVMILDPPAYGYFSDRPAVAVPNNDPATALIVARHYGARFILLEPAHTLPMHGLYSGAESNTALTLRLHLSDGHGEELKVYELD